MGRNVNSSAVFTSGSTSLSSNFTWTLIPIHYSWRQKTTDTGLPDGEERIPVFLRFDAIPRSVTDRRADGFDVAYTALGKLVLRRAVKIDTQTDTYTDVTKYITSRCCMAGG